MISCEVMTFSLFGFYLNTTSGIICSSTYFQRNPVGEELTHIRLPDDVCVLCGVLEIVGVVFVVRHVVKPEKNTFKMKNHNQREKEAALN